MLNDIARTGMLAALLSAGLGAQDGVTARLSADSGVVKLADGGVALTLTVDVAADTDLPASVLEGLDLQIKVEGSEVGNVREGGGDQTVRVAGGTQITRRMHVDLLAHGVRLQPTALTNVSLSWPGLNGASAMVEVAPDVSSIDLSELDLDKTQVVLATSLGQMTLRFYPDKAPRHVENFLKLVKSGFYDGTKFHRVINGFMIQGGDPNTKEGATGTVGTGGPGWTVDAEFNDVRHVRGILSMARGPDPNSAGSQFFIVQGQASHLDGQYSAFGVLESGFDTLDRIAAVPVGPPDGTTPVEPVYLYYAVLLPALKT